MILTIIIGKNSNLSKKLFNKLPNCFLVSSRELLESVDVLSQFKNKNKNIIFNNFQPATELNSIQNSELYIKNSILSTSIVLEYFKDTDVNKIIYTSSSSVYGNNIFCKEEDALRPMNLHASLKVANEKLIEKYCNENSIDYTIARIFNMYGGDDKFSIISKILYMYFNKKDLTIVNNGNAIRDFIHIDDVVSIYLSILNLQNVKIVNIGTGYGSSIKNILDFLLNNDIKIKTKNIYKDELKTSTADTKLLFKIINKETFIKIEDYLKVELKL
ncbi:MAG: NAD-dependent epimerase [Sulfurimonas sp.]|nr:MAG: NAD-dependent epimerase [Sulfurimonas sp.]